jgi:Flp pilus assembly protein TadG
MARWRRREEGSVSVEFAILVPLFLLLVFGIIDFGHAFYMKHLITNACREGARYGVKYQTDSLGNHIIPINLNPSIQNYILNTSTQNGGLGGWSLSSMLPSDANPQVPTPTGPGYTSGVAGDDLIVTVTARKNWFVLGHLVPTLGSYKDISVSTDMKVE